MFETIQVTRSAKGTLLILSRRLEDARVELMLTRTSDRAAPEWLGHEGWQDSPTRVSLACQGGRKGAVVFVPESSAESLSPDHLLGVFCPDAGFVGHLRWGESGMGVRTDIVPPAEPAMLHPLPLPEPGQVWDMQEAVAPEDMAADDLFEESIVDEDVVEEDVSIADLIDAGPPEAEAIEDLADDDAFETETPGAVSLDEPAVEETPEKSAFEVDQTDPVTAEPEPVTAFRDSLASGEDTVHIGHAGLSEPAHAISLETASAEAAPLEAAPLETFPLESAPIMASRIAFVDGPFDETPGEDASLDGPPTDEAPPSNGPAGEASPREDTRLGAIGDGFSVPSLASPLASRFAFSGAAFSDPCSPEGVEIVTLQPGDLPSETFGAPAEAFSEDALLNEEDASVEDPLADTPEEIYEDTPESHHNDAVTDAPVLETPSVHVSPEVLPVGTPFGDTAADSPIDAVAPDALPRLSALTTMEAGTGSGATRFRFPRPEIRLPRPSLSAANLPDFKWPSLRLPQFSFPDFSLPELTIPELTVAQKRVAAGALAVAVVAVVGTALFTLRTPSEPALAPAPVVVGSNVNIPAPQTVGITPLPDATTETPLPEAILPQAAPPLSAEPEFVATQPVVAPSTPPATIDIPAPEPVVPGTAEATPEDTATEDTTTERQAPEAAPPAEPEAPALQPAPVQTATPSEDEILVIQSHLKALRLYEGDLDGRMGADTSNAITLFGELYAMPDGTSFAEMTTRLSEARAAQDAQEAATIAAGIAAEQAAQEAAREAAAREAAEREATLLTATPASTAPEIAFTPYSELPGPEPLSEPTPQPTPEADLSGIPGEIELVIPTVPEAAPEAVAEPAPEPVVQEVRLTKRGNVYYPSRALSDSAVPDAVSVIVTYDVDTKGRADNIEARVEGYEGRHERAFIKAARNAVESQRFEPRTEDGIPTVQTGMTRAVRFNKY